MATKKKAAPKRATKPQPVKRAAPKPQAKVDAVFLKDAPRYGKKGEVRKMTPDAIKYINSRVKGAVKKK